MILKIKVKGKKVEDFTKTVELVDAVCDLLEEDKFDVELISYTLEKGELLLEEDDDDTSVDYSDSDENDDTLQ